MVECCTINTCGMLRYQLLIFWSKCFIIIYEWELQKWEFMLYERVHSPLELFKIVHMVHSWYKDTFHKASHGREMWGSIWLAWQSNKVCNPWIDHSPSLLNFTFMAKSIMDYQCWEKSRFWKRPKKERCD